MSSSSSATSAWRAVPAIRERDAPVFGRGVFCRQGPHREEVMRPPFLIWGERS